MKHHKNSYILFICMIVLVGTFLDSEAKKIRQVHKIESTSDKKLSVKKKDNLKKRRKRVPVHSSCLIHLNDSTNILFEADSIKFTGYDKPVTASKESFHIINASTAPIKKVGIRVTYSDLKDRMLHQREEIVNCNIPAGETRLTAISSWDMQHTFFYYLGPEPRRVATPYKVLIELLWVEL